MLRALCFLLSLCSLGAGPVHADMDAETCIPFLEADAAYEQAVKEIGAGTHDLLPGLLKHVKAAQDRGFDKWASGVKGPDPDIDVWMSDPAETARARATAHAHRIRLEEYRAAYTGPRSKNPRVTEKLIASVAKRCQKVFP